MADPLTEARRLASGAYLYDIVTYPLVLRLDLLRAALAEVDRLRALLPSTDPNPAYLAQIASITAESKITCADCLHMGQYGCDNLDKSAQFRCKHRPPPVSDKTPLPYARLDCAGYQEKP